MKITKILLNIFIFATILVSCEDAIDIQQPGLLTADNAIKTVADLELNMNAIYGYLDNTSEIRFNALYTDEIAKGIENGGQGASGYELILNSNSTFPYNLVRANNTIPIEGNIKKGYHIILSHINRFIDVSSSINPTAAEQVAYDAVLGEAYALRAYCHFQMQTYLSTDMTDDNALGCIILDRVPGLTEDLARSNNGDVFDFISNDLSTAFNLLPATSAVTKINQDFVTAMRARMNAYRGKYGVAITQANILLAKYPISNQTEFTNMFKDTSNGECIFKLDRTVNDDWDRQGTTGGGWAGSLFAFIDPSFGGGPYMEMSRALYSKLNINDVRYNTYIHPTSTFDAGYATNPNFLNTDVILINKYPGSDGQPLMNDLKIFRASEMLFIKAEAQADANSLTDVATTLKELQDARFGSAQPLMSFASKSEAFGAILDERRIELAFEGHRWVDLKRLGVIGNRNIEKDPTECALTGACTLSATDYRFTVPYPVEETDLNQLLDQNPGY